MHIKVSALPEGYEIMSYELTDIGNYIEQETNRISSENPGCPISLSRNKYGLEGWTLCIDGYKLIVNMQLPPPGVAVGPDLSIALYSAIIVDAAGAAEYPDETQMMQGSHYLYVAEYELCLEEGGFKWFDRAGSAEGLRSVELVSLLVNKLLAATGSMSRFTQ